MKIDTDKILALKGSTAATTPKVGAELGGDGVAAAK